MCLHLSDANPIFPLTRPDKMPLKLIMGILRAVELFSDTVFYRDFLKIQYY
jgi:hypothetical protein